MNGSAAFGKWYLRAVTSEIVNVDGLAEHMAAHNTTFSKGTIKGILTDAVACIKELLLEGKGVKLEDLAIFRLGLICTGAEKAEDAKPSNVTGYRVNAMGTGQMAVTRIKSQAKLSEAMRYEGGQDPVDTPEGD